MSIKSINVDVDIDVEIDMFDTEDIVEELCYRLKYRKDEINVDKLLTLITKGKESFYIDSLIDQMKLEHFSEVFKEYSFEEVITKLPSKV